MFDRELTSGGRPQTALLKPEVKTIEVIRVFYLLDKLKSRSGWSSIDNSDKLEGVGIKETEKLR